MVCKYLLLYLVKYGDLGQRNDCRKSETGDEDNDDDEQVYFITLMTILKYTFPQKGRLYILHISTTCLFMLFNSA